MKAIKIAAHGDASVLKLEETPIPNPAKGQALVRLKAAGLNFIDIYMRIGRYPRELPFTPGLEGAGIDYIIDGVGKTTFTKDLDAVRVYGQICIFGSASGPADPIAPNTLQQKSITVSGGSLFNCMNTREELLKRANDVLTGIKNGWLKLKIDHVFKLDQASKAQEELEGRKTSGKVILTMGK